MAKGDDSVRRKKNKENRKKNQKESSTVSARIAAMIAAKKRRKSGKRRMCEGMCFSLPTPEDPFNERHEKKEFSRKETKKLVPPRADGRVSVNGKSAPSRKETHGRNLGKVDYHEQKRVKVMNLESEQKATYAAIDNVGQKNPVEPGKAMIQLSGKGGVVNGRQGQAFENSDCPSKFLILCLNSIQKALMHDDRLNSEEDRPLFVNTWGVEFWKCYSIGNDILETSGVCSTVDQISWIVSTAADTIARKEKEGLSFTSPFLLFLVPSQEKATKVRSVCKPLKALGIHAVSLHPGASLDHQIHGLKSCEPEFLVSTPERLLELVSLKAIDISGVSLLVVDGLDTLKDGCLDMIKSIRQSISGNPQTVVFDDCLSYTSIPAVQTLLMGSICRLSLNDSVASRSACIVQSVHVCASEKEKLLKGFQVLDQACSNELCLPLLSKVLFIVGKDSKFYTLVTAMKAKGYSISTNSICDNSKLDDRKMRPLVSVIDMEKISAVNLEEYKFVIIPDFVLSIDDYVQILTRMARSTVNGVLQSIFTTEDAPLAGPLIDILEQCGQAVPEALKKLCHSTSSMLE